MRNLKFDPEPGWQECLINALIQNKSRSTIPTEEEIEKRLNLETCPSILELAKLSELAYESYEDIKTNLKGPLKEYKLICSVKEDSYRGSVFFRPGNKNRHRQLIIAHKGTKSKKDFEADFNGIIKNQHTDQIYSAITFVLKQIQAVYSSTLDVRPSLEYPLSIIVTGHSLGGWLAQVTTFALKYLDFNKNAGETYVRYIDERCHPICVVFDSPGAELILQYLKAQYMATTERNHVSLDITNYVLSPNVINILNPHFGSVIQIKTEQDNVAIPTGIVSLYMHISKYHSISKFLEVLDTQKIFKETPKKDSFLYRWFLVKYWSWIFPTITRRFFNRAVVEPELEPVIPHKIDYYHIISWPMTVLEGWNTKIDRHKPHKSIGYSLLNLVKQVYQASDVIKKIAEFLEYLRTEKNLNDRQNFDYELISPPNAYSLMLRLSDRETEFLKLFEHLHLLMERFGNELINNASELLSFLNKEKIWSKIEMSRRQIIFLNSQHYLFLKNLCLFYSPCKIQAEIERFPHFGEVALLVSSNWYCTEFLENYDENVAFSNYWDISPIFSDNKNLEIVKDEKDNLLLVLLNLIVGRKQGKLKEIEIIKFSEDTWNLVHRNNTSFNQVKFVVVDAIDAEFSDEEIERFRVKNCKYLWLKKVAKAEKASYKNWFSFPGLEIHDEVFEKLLSKIEFVQGQQCRLGDIVSDTDSLKSHLKWNLVHYDGNNTSFKQVKFIVIDTIDGKLSDDEIDEIKNQFRVKNCKYLWLKKVAKAEKASSKNWFSFPGLEIHDEVFEKLLSKLVFVQGQQCQLRTIVSDTDSLKSHLSETPSSLLSLLRNDVSIGKMPKTMQELKSNYFEIEITMTDEELEIHYAKPVTAECTVVVYSNGDSDLNRESVMSLFLKPLSGNVIFWSQKLDDPFHEFQQLCKNESDRTLDLVFYIGKSTYKLKYQYNPNFYKLRTLIEPGWDLGPIFKKLKDKNKNYKFFMGDREPDFKLDLSLRVNDNRLDQKLNTKLSETLKKCKEMQITEIYFAKNDSLYIKYGENGYLDVDKKNETEVKEQEMLSNLDFLVLSDEPGMGKSTTVANLAHNLLKTESHIIKKMTWVILIELKTFTDLKECADQTAEDEFIQTWSKCVGNNQNHSELENFFFIDLLTSQKHQVVFIADGFDELKSEDKPHFEKILLKLKWTTAKILVTTRPHDKSILESALVTYSHTFQPIHKEEDKIDFLVNLWSTALREKDRNNLSMFATELLKKAHKKLIKGRVTFLGVPLQLRMLSEVFLDDARKYISSENKETSSLTTYTLLEIYNMFLKRKLKIFLFQKLEIPDQSNWEIIQHVTETSLDPTMYWLAGKVLNFGENYNYLIKHFFGVTASDLTTDIKNKIYGIGVVYDAGNDKVQFLHRTFAEFYAAKFIMLVLENIVFREINHETIVVEKFTDIFTNDLCDDKKNDRDVVLLFLNDMIKERLSKEEVDVFSRLKNYNQKSKNKKIRQATNPNTNIVEHLIEKKFPYILDFFIHVYKVSLDELESAMNNFQINLCFLFAKPLDNFKWIFIILNRLKQLDRCNIEDRRIWAGVDRTYSIKDVIDEINQNYTESKGNFFGTLLFVKDYVLGRGDVLNGLNALVDNGGGEFVNFPFPQFQFSNKHEFHDKCGEIMRFDTIPKFEDIRNRHMAYSLMRGRDLSPNDFMELMMEEFYWIERYDFID